MTPAPTPLPTAAQVACYILQRSPRFVPVRTLHLLAYYAQANSLVTRGTPLFLDPIVAHPAGPFIPALAADLTTPQELILRHYAASGRLESHVGTVRPRKTA